MKNKLKFYYYKFLSLFKSYWIKETLNTKKKEFIYFDVEEALKNKDIKAIDNFITIKNHNKYLPVEYKVLKYFKVVE